MHTLKRAPQRTQSSHLCSQCRHATTVTRATAQRNQILRIRVQDARIARREDYLLGPLAPNRFAEDESYGCMQSIELESEKIRKKAKGQSPYQAEQIKWKENMVWVGDRVAVVAETGPASRERGKVGTVIKVKRDTGVVEVEELNMVGFSCVRALFRGWRQGLGSQRLPFYATAVLEEAFLVCFQLLIYSPPSF